MGGQAEEMRSSRLPPDSAWEFYSLAVLPIPQELGHVFFSSGLAFTNT
jgi:hypothetical protein